MALLLTACGVEPTGPADGGEAPTGVAPGVTLYFVDANHQLRPQLRATGRLGSISEAVSLLLQGPGSSGLHTEITSVTTTRVVVTTAPGLVQLSVPLAARDVTALGIDQIVCTALGVHVQSGGSRNDQAQVGFTLASPESDRRRTCPAP
ncbi:hypothetical protein FNH07_15305 [Amycolatopsis bartoniae]|nr:hypothetical protein FNH07_15305 [Amycolatopsis bartoniae]